MRHQSIGRPKRPGVVHGFVVRWLLVVERRAAGSTIATIRRAEDARRSSAFPGLTRNARDFEGVAERLAGDWRVICVDLRGRGESAYAKDPMTYVPLTYLQDMAALLAELALERFVLFGTSLGG